MLLFIIGIILIKYSTEACKTRADVSTNLDILENLAKIIGIENGALQSWIADGALTGVEDGAVVGVEEDGIKNWIERGGVTGVEEGGVDVLDNMKEIIGVEADGIKVDTDITTGGITVGVIAVVFGIMFFWIVIQLIRNNNNQKDKENSSTIQVEMLQFSLPCKFD